MSYSGVFICTAADRDTANRLGRALGYDLSPDPGNSYSVEMSSDGSTVTHYGGHHAAVNDDFVAVFAGAAQGQLPPIVWEDYNLTAAEVADVLPRLIISIDTAGQYADPRAHIDAVMAANGLQMMPSEAV